MEVKTVANPRIWCPVCRSDECYRAAVYLDGYMIRGWRCHDCNRWLRSG